MAYVTQERNRAATIAAVGALHAAAIYALVTGLAGPAWEKITQGRTEGTNIPVPQVPTDPVEQPNTKRPKVADPVIRDPAHGGETVLTSDPIVPTTQDPVGPQAGDGTTGTGTGPVADYPVQQTIDPVFPPKLARPIGRPGSWVTTNDYPASSLRMGHEGVTRFQLSIGADGKVQSCEVTISSGHAALDDAACATLRKRGKFVAATGPDGGAVAGTYSSAVRWTLPKDY